MKKKTIKQRANPDAKTGYAAPQRPGKGEFAKARESFEEQHQKSMQVNGKLTALANLVYSSLHEWDIPGALNAADYREFILPHTRRIFERLAGHGVPTIHFGVGTGSILAEIRDAGGNVIGVDWRTPIDEAWERVGSDRAVQGNLDPTLVFAPTEVMTARAAEIVEAGRAARGHIFNLGHGVIPSTDPGQLTALTEFVQGWSTEAR